MVLNFEGGYLRPLKCDDVHVGYISGLNDPVVNHYLVGVKSIKQTRQSVVDFVRAEEQSDDAVLWGIWSAGRTHHVGTIRIHGIENRHRTAHIGVCIFDKTIWGQGIGSKAIQAATRWGLNVFGIRWIEAGVYQENIASQKAFLSAGYSWVFDIPEKYIFDGKPTTVKVYAALNKLVDCKIIESHP